MVLLIAVAVAALGSAGARARSPDGFVPVTDALLQCDPIDTTRLTLQSLLRTVG